VLDCGFAVLIEDQLGYLGKFLHVIAQDVRPLDVGRWSEAEGAAHGRKEVGQSDRLRKACSGAFVPG